MDEDFFGALTKELDLGEPPPELDLGPPPVLDLGPEPLDTTDPEAQGQPILSIDFTNETMSASYVLPNGQELDSASLDLVGFAADGVDPIEKLVSMLTAKVGLTGGNPSSAMIVISADVDPEKNTVLNYPGAEWLNYVHLPDVLSRALGIPVHMERRAVVQLAYDIAMLGVPQEALSVGCYVDQHYHGAIWYNGAPMEGMRGLAGNIGHLTIHGREDNCYCGKQGCVDLYGTGQRLDQIHRMIFPDSGTDELFERYSEHPILMDYISMMAYPIAILCDIMDPEFVILGGSIPAQPGFPRVVLESEIIRQMYNVEDSAEVTFLPSPSSEVSGVILGAQYAKIKGFA